jgi:hypothetical protein
MIQFVMILIVHFRTVMDLKLKIQKLKVIGINQLTFAVQTLVNRMVDYLFKFKLQKSHYQ